MTHRPGTADASHDGVPPSDPADPSAAAAPRAMPPAAPAIDAPVDDDAVPPELRPLADRYTVLGELGRGGMAVVYHARERTPDGTLARDVAIKVVGHRYTGDADAVRRFEREARTVAELDHPNIVRTLAIEPLADGALAIVSRYVPGETLRGALRAAGGPLDFARAAAVLRDLAAALAHAHARRIVHRDVKPENVFLEAGTGRALLADFGIARRLDVDSPLTVDGSALGTPTYMAPEQITGHPVDQRTDVYALGLVGWEMLAGRRPWQGETLYAVLHRQQHDVLPDLALLRPDIPAYLLAAVRGALAKDPAGRWRDGAEVLARLTLTPVALPALPDTPAGDDETLRADHTMRVTPEPTRAIDRRGMRWRRRTGPAVGARRWAAVAAMVAALGVSGALLLRQRTDAARRAADAAMTGVTDAQLDSLLRAAATAAPIRGGAPAARAAGAPTPAAQPPPAPPAAASPSVAPPGTAAPGTRAPTRSGVGAPRTSATTTRPVRTTSRTPDARPRSASADPSVPLPAALAADARCRSPASDDQRACLLAAVDRADAPLTREYQALIALLRRRAGGALEPPAVEALRVEQRAWVSARDRQCRAALTGREGRFWGAARAPCFAEISDRRAAALRERLARYAGTAGPPS